jgi:hypothetical protein
VLPHIRIFLKLSMEMIMSNALLSSPFQANKEKLLTLRLQNELNTTRIFKALDADPNTIGAEVVFIDYEYSL